MIGTAKKAISIDHGPNSRAEENSEEAALAPIKTGRLSCAN